jgi:hypothetical protein
MQEQERIGEVAGKVWRTLGKKGELSITMLPKFIKEQNEMIYQSVGWLAREGKIIHTKKDNKNFISLTSPEMEAYRNASHTKH